MARRRDLLRGIAGDRREGQQLFAGLGSHDDDVRKSGLGPQAPGATAGVSRCAATAAGSRSASSD